MSAGGVVLEPEVLAILAELEKREYWIGYGENDTVAALIDAAIEQMEKSAQGCDELEFGPIRDLTAHLLLRAAVRFYRTLPERFVEAAAEGGDEPESKVLAERVTLLMRLMIYNRVFSGARRKFIGQTVGGQ